MCGAFTPAAYAQNDPNLLVRRYVSQVADGGGWNTRLTIVNSNDVPAGGVFEFFDSSGRPLALPIRQGGFSQTADSIRVAVLAKGSATVETYGTGATVVQGYATFTYSLGTPGGSTIFAVFGQQVQGRPDFEATVGSTDALTQRYGVAFDNTNGFSLGLALLNPDSKSGDYWIAAWDEAGNQILTSVVTLNPLNHIAFSLPAKFPETVNRRGYLEVSRIFTGGRPTSVSYPYLVLTALRFNPTGSFSAAPVIVLRTQ